MPVKSDVQGGPEIYQVEDRVLVPSEDQGNVGMLLRGATTMARKGTLVEVEYVEEGSLGKDVVRRREISKIVVHGSGSITIHLKD